MTSVGFDIMRCSSDFTKYTDSPGNLVKMQILSYWGMTEGAIDQPWTSMALDDEIQNKNTNFYY